MAILKSSAFNHDCITQRDAFRMAASLSALAPEDVILSEILLNGRPFYQLRMCDDLTSSDYVIKTWGAYRAAYKAIKAARAHARSQSGKWKTPAPYVPTCEECGASLSAVEAAGRSSGVCNECLDRRSPERDPEGEVNWEAVAAEMRSEYDPAEDERYQMSDAQIQAEAEAAAEREADEAEARWTRLILANCCPRCESPRTYDTTGPYDAVSSRRCETCGEKYVTEL